jgi:hypothetical protein
VYFYFENGFLNNANDIKPYILFSMITSGYSCDEFKLLFNGTKFTYTLNTYTYKAPNAGGQNLYVLRFLLGNLNKNCEDICSTDKGYTQIRMSVF